MAALQCEICGGKLLAKAGGLFECEYCGMQYDKTRIQEMVQEIKGTVKVEGTVEVKGTVKVDNTDNAKNCALRAIQILQTKSPISMARPGSGSADYNKKLYAEVDGIFNDALKLDPTCPEAHVGLLLRAYWVSSIEELAEYARSNNFDIRVSNYYENAEKYSRGTPMHDQLMAVVAEIEEKKNAKAYQEAVKLMEQQGYASAEEILREIPGYRDADELRQKCADAAKQMHAGVEEIVRLYWDTFPNSHKVVCDIGLFAAITGDGRVAVSVSKGPEDYQKNFEDTVAKWQNVKDICICGMGGPADRPTNALIGLTKDGRILAAGMLGSYGSILNMQTDIAWMKTDGYRLAMVSNAGNLTVVPQLDAMFKPGYNEVQMDWRHITYLYFDGAGRIVAYNQKNKWLGRVKGDYHYTEVVQDTSEYEKSEQEIPNCRSPFEYKTLTIPVLFQKPIVFNDLVDYYREFFREGYNWFWALTKEGDVLCDSEHSPKRMNLGAVAMFPCAKEHELLKGHCLFLLADGSFVEIIMKFHLGDTICEIKKYPNLRVFDGVEGLRAQKADRESVRKQLSEEQENLKKELSNLKGLFTGKRRKEIEARLAEIETELKGL